jgi:lipoprotein-releasing system permease protein
VSLFSTIGVAVGVMALVIALALMTGLQGELRSKLLGAIAHVYVTKAAGIDDYQAEAAKLRKIPGVVGAAPSVVGLALISPIATTPSSPSRGSIRRSRWTSPTSGRRCEGALEDLAPRTLEDGHRGVAGHPVGQDLAGKLGVSVGERVTLFTPQGTLSPLGVLPRSRSLRVAGIYSLGLLEFDSAYGLVSLDFGERLLSRAEPTSFRSASAISTRHPPSPRTSKPPWGRPTTHATGRR